MLLAVIFKELIYDFIQLSLEMRASSTNYRRAVRNKWKIWKIVL